MKKSLLYICSIMCSFSLYAYDPEGMEELTHGIPEQAMVSPAQLLLLENQLDIIQEQIGAVQFSVTLARDQEYNKDVWKKILIAIVQIIKSGNTQDKDAIFAAIHALIEKVKEQGEQANGIHGSVNINFGASRDMHQVRQSAN